MNKLTNILLTTIVATTAIVATTRGAEAGYVPTEGSKGYLTELTVGIDTTQDTGSCYILPGDTVSLIGSDGLGVFAIDSKGCSSTLSGPSSSYYGSAY